jgi:hypothetical protein
MYELMYWFCGHPSRMCPVISGLIYWHMYWSKMKLNFRLKMGRGGWGKMQWDQLLCSVLGFCYGENMKYPIDSCVEHLAPSWWCYFGRLLKLQEVGKLEETGHWGPAFEGYAWSSVAFSSSASSLPWGEESPTAMMFCFGAMDRTLWNHEPK